MKTALFYPVSYSSERQEEKSSSLRGANKRAYFGKISGHAMSPLFFGGTKTPTIPLFRGKRRRCAGDSINLLLVVWLLPLRGVGYTIQMIMKGKYLKRRRYFPFPFSLGWTVIDSKLKGKVYYLLRPFSLGWTININSFVAADSRSWPDCKVGRKKCFLGREKVRCRVVAKKWARKVGIG